MKKPYELTWDQLKPDYSAGNLHFSTTAELTPLDGIIGQDRAVEAMEFGLSVRKKGYNIYMAGLPGTGKTTYARKSAMRKAAEQPVPSDWCYVMNFRDEKRPSAISFPAGQGRAFKKDMEQLVELLKNELQKAFIGEEYVTKKNSIAKDTDNKRKVLIAKLNEIGNELGFAARFTEEGLQLHPLINGKVMDEAAYQQLTESQLETINSNSVIFSEKASGLLRDLDALEREDFGRQEKLDQEIGTRVMQSHIDAMKEKYEVSPKACAYLDDVKVDILENMDDFIDEEDPSEDQITALLKAQSDSSDPSERYRVNLIVDHSGEESAPVVTVFSPTYQDLSGEVEINTDGNYLTTDYMGIKGGQLHQANGGFLIVQAYDILTTPGAWEVLRRVMKTSEISVGPARGGVYAQAMPFLKPEPIPADLKIIMIGNGSYYELMREADEEFGKFFKVRADFDYEMPASSENIEKVTEFMKRLVENEKIPDFDAGAAAKVLEYSSRNAERQDKLSTRFNLLADILCEAAAWAEADRAELITAEYVQKAIDKKEDRLRLYEEKIKEMYDNDEIMIATEGSETGQINALAVLDTGDYAFGIPSRITATAYVGQSGIVNIEKEAEMSGQTHNKGVQIISGYLGQMYAQKFPLSLSCRICFEQSYSGIDGDSASSTELYAILSALSSLPIRQDLAVTGSVNQRGRIQAIGGVNYKIEGFFDLCRRRGLTGSQGVLIPVSNMKDLVLKDDVVQAVEEGKFHIYPVKTIDEGIELLTGCPAGEPDAEGKYPQDSVHGRVYERLKAFNDAASDS